MRLGSSRECDLIVDAPTVSRSHAILKRVEGTWVMQDSGSTNGTWVNGRKISSLTYLVVDDHISFGAARFFFLKRGQTSAPLNELASGSVTRASMIQRAIALSPRDFELLIGELFSKMGFESIVTKQSGDGGVDVIAVNKGLIYRGRYLVQCKRYRGENKVARPEVVSFYGRIASDPGTKGIFVTTSIFTRGAREFADSNGVNLIDREDLERLLQKHDPFSAEKP